MTNELLPQFIAKSIYSFGVTDGSPDLQRSSHFMKKCTRCKVDRDDSEFFSKYHPNRKIKVCTGCRETSNKNNERRKKGISPPKEVLRLARIEALKRGNFICSTCKKEKPVSEFKKMGTDLVRFGLSCACYDCRNITYKKSRAKSEYNISSDELLAMYESQNYRCAICNDPVKFTSNRADRNAIGCVDHCHDTGKVRGILCNDCNRGMGFFKDNSKLLEKASRYILKHKQ